MWNVLKKHLPRDEWVPIEQIYSAIETHLSLVPADFEPAAASGQGVTWQRTVQKVLQYRVKTGELLWPGADRYMLLSDARQALIKQEYELRRDIWNQLLQRGGQNNVLPNVIRDLGFYRGQAGIFADRERTSPLTGGHVGVTVSVLHTGSAYPDDVGEDGILYHYPLTQRPGASDQNEIEATKWAGRLRLPIFVVTYPHPDAAVRNVRLGWVSEWLDRERIFRIAFSDTPPPPAEPEQTEVEDDFQLVSPLSGGTRLMNTRPGQSRFKFDILRRYGGRCAVCDLEISALIDGAHILPKGRKGSDDARNGLPLCANHHRAFDADHFGIHPETLEIHVRRTLTSDALRLTRQDISHLPNKPHRAALQARWIYRKSE